MIAWVDTETSGLDERDGYLLEVAVVLTSDDLFERSYLQMVLKPTSIKIDDLVERLDPYVRDMHLKNGLVEEIRDHGVDLHEAEQVLTSFVNGAFAREPHVPSGRCLKCKLGKKSHGDPLQPLVCADGTPFQEGADPAIRHSPLAGSTIPFDRRWLRQHLTRFEGLFSHRSIDVSSITELARRWAPIAYELRPRGGELHRALSDIRGSIDLLRYYRGIGFTGIQQSSVEGFDGHIEYLRKLGLKVSR
jgi:oligoribonuclease